jgi:hypothetical protein
MPRGLYISGKAARSLSKRLLGPTQLTLANKGPHIAGTAANFHRLEPLRTPCERGPWIMAAWP